MKKPIRDSEWIFVGTFFLLLLSLCIIAEVQRRQFSLQEIEFAVEETVTVEITGAVVKPGVYEMPLGEKLETFLKKAKPKKWADVSALNLEEPVSAPLKIFLEEKKEIEIEIRGAVLEKKKLLVPRGTKVRDLKGKIELAPEADPSFFQSRKVVKEGEVLEVPHKRG